MNLPKNHPSRIRPVHDECGNCVAIRYSPQQWRALAVFPIYLADVIIALVMAYCLIFPVYTVLFAGASANSETWIWLSLSLAAFFSALLVIMAEKVLMEALRQWPHLHRRTIITFFPDRMVISQDGSDSVVLPWDQLQRIRPGDGCLLFRGHRRIFLPKHFWAQEYPLHKMSFHQILGSRLEIPPRFSEGTFLRNITNSVTKVLEDDVRKKYGRQCQIVRDDDGSVREIVLPLSAAKYFGYAFACVLGQVMLTAFFGLGLYWVFTDDGWGMAVMPLMALCGAWFAWNSYWTARWLFFWFPGNGSLRFQREQLVLFLRGREKCVYRWEALLKICRRCDFDLMIFKRSDCIFLPTFPRHFRGIVYVWEKDFHDLLGDLLEEKRELSVSERLVW